MSRKSKPKKQIGIEDFLFIPLRTFDFAAVKLIKWKSTDQRSIYEWIYLVISVLNVTFNLTCKMVVPVFDSFRDALQLTTWIVYISFGANCICKLVSVWWVRNMLEDVILNLRSMFPLTEMEQRDFRVKKYYDKLMRYLHFLHDFHWTVAFMFVLFPITQSLVEYIGGWREDSAFAYRLPYIMTYPFDSQKPWGYSLAYITQLGAGLTVSCYFLGADMLMIASVHILNMQFDYLSKRIGCFKSHGEKADLCELKVVVKRHSLLLKYAERINIAFSISNLMNYMLSVVIICLIGFQVVAGSGFFDLSKFGAFLIASLTDVYLICRFGTNLIISSEKVSEALCGQEWFQTNVRYQRMLPIAIARAQRPAQLTAYKFFIITIESFTTLITTSYQFFTLIKTRYDEANQCK